MIRLDVLQGDIGEPGRAGEHGEPGGAGGRGGAGGKGEPGGRGGEGGAGGRGGDAPTYGQGNGNDLDALRSGVERRQGRSHIINYVTAAILLFLTGWALVGWWKSEQAIKIKSLTISEVQVLSQGALCPGDMLVIQYSLTIDGLGEIIFGDSVYHGEHPVKFSEPYPLVVGSSRTLQTEDEWTIPPRPDRAIDGRREWAAGSYTRLVSVAPSNSYVSRFTPPAILEVPFFVQEGCE